MDAREKGRKIITSHTKSLKNFTGNGEENMGQNEQCSWNVILLERFLIKPGCK